VPVTRTVGGSWTDIRDCPILRKPTAPAARGVSRGNLLRRPVGTRSSHRPSSGVPSTSDRELARRSRSRWGGTGSASALHHRARQRARRLPCARRSSARRCQAGRRVGHTDRFLVTTPVDIEVAAEQIGDNRRTIALNYSPALSPVRIPARVSLQLREGRGRVFGPPEAPSRPGSAVRKCGTAEPGRNQQHARTGPTLYSEQHSLTLTCKPPSRSSHS
jgi:hypothetical protein